MAARGTPGRRSGVGLLLVVLLLGCATPPPDSPPAALETHREVPRRIASAPGPPISGTATIHGILRHGVDPGPGRVEVWRLPPLRDDRLRTLDLDEAWLEDTVDDAPVATTVVGEDGVFRIAGIAPGRYRLIGSASDAKRAWIRVRIRAPGETLRADLFVRSGPLVLRGRARWADGRPFLGVMAADPYGTSWVEPRDRSVRTDADGGFEIPGVRPGTCRTLARVPGLAFYRGGVIRNPVDGEIEIVVDRECREISGRVVSEADGSPVPGARILAGGDGDFTWAVLRTIADAEGRFRLRVPPDFQLAVGAPGFTAGIHYLDAGDGPSEDIVVALPPAGRIRGRLVDPSGRPVAGIPVLAVPLDTQEPRALVRTVSAEDGSFLLEGVCDVEVALVALGAGWASPRFASLWESLHVPQAIRVPPGREVTATVVAVPAAHVSGRVVDEDGNGLPGVAVVARPLRERGHPFLVTRTVSGPDGRFVFGSIPPDVGWELIAAPGSGLESTPWTVAAASGETEAAEILILADRWVTLRIVDSVHGTRVAGAWAAVTVDGRVMRGNDPAWTDRNGLLRLGPLPPGMIRIHVGAEGYVTSDPLDYVHLDLPEHLTVSLVRGLAIEGRVLLSDGTPAPGGSVSGGLERTRSRGAWPHYDVDVDGSGRFRISGLSTGTHLLHAWLSQKDGLRATGDVPVRAGARDVELRLGALQRREAEIRLRVTDPDGRPVPKVSFTYLGRETTPAEKRAGVVVVDVGGARAASGRRLPLGWTSLGPLVPDGREVHVRLPPEKTIRGRIVDGTGRGISGLRLEAIPLEPKLGHRRSRGRTDGRGSFEIGGLGDGRHRISFQLPIGFLGERKYEVDAGASGLEIVLDEMELGPVVRVLDPHDRPLPGARVCVFAGRTAVGQETTDEDGTVFLRGLPEGTDLRLEVLPPPVRPDLAPFRQWLWSPEHTDVRPVAGRFVEGLLHLSDGRSGAGLRVVARASEGDWRMVPVGSDGWFRIGPFPAGAVRIAASDPENRAGELLAVTPAEVESGATNLRVRVLDGLRRWFDPDGRR